MEKIFNKIIEFLKNIFGSNIENKVDNHSKYNINKVEYSYDLSELSEWKVIFSLFPQM